MEKEMKKKITIATIAIVGIITTIKLAIIYYNANFNPYALSSFCSVNEFIDCDGIAKTPESQFLGIPLAYWGMFFYAFVFLMLFAKKLKNFKLFKFMEVFKNPFDYIASLGLLAFVISMILLCLSLFDIKKLCILCAFTYILNFAIGCVATDFKNGGFIHSIKQSVLDFIDAIKIKKYLIAFIAVVAVAVGFLAYTRITFKFAPQVKRQLEFKEFKHKKNKYAVKGNLLGDENAKVVVYVYSDYQCPVCPIHNAMMHKLAKEVKGIKIIHRNLPLDTDCNAYLQAPFHQGSCIDAQYSIAAEKQGKLWEMNEILFEKKPQTEEEILNLVANKGFDLDKLQEDANSLETQNELKKDIDFAYKHGIMGTPSTMINNDVYVGIKPYKEFKEWVEKYGAAEK
mgnify:CR=1 FL=1